MQNPALAQTSVPRALLARIKNGFNLRRQRLEARLGAKTREPNGQIPVHTDADRRNPSGYRGSIDLRSLSQRFLRKEIPLGQYITYMRSLLPEQYHDLIICYFFSGEYVLNPDTLIEQSTVDDEELSILCQTLVLADQLRANGLMELVEKELSVLRSSFYKGAQSLSKVDSF